MEIGICSISARERSIDDIMEIASSVGFSFLEIWAKEPHVGTKSRADAERIAGSGDRYAIDTLGYGSYVRAGVTSPPEVTEELEFASQLGADYIRVWAGEQEYESYTEDHWNEVVDDLRMIADRAARHDIEVTVERHFGTLTNRREGASRLLRAVDHPNCALNWQTYCETNPDSHNNIQQTEAEVLADIRELAPISNNVHIQSWGSPDASERCLVEDSFYDWGKILDELREVGYSGRFEIEFTDPNMDYERALQRDYDALREYDLNEISHQ